MLYGKINPTAKVVKQDSPFTSTTVEANYMGAIARPYSLGATNVDFEVVYGNLVDVPAKEGKTASQKFERVTSSSVKLTAAEIANWGTDDTVVLAAVATKVGTTASDFVTIEGEGRF
jgi:hypothetical protein